MGFEEGRGSKVDGGRGGDLKGVRRSGRLVSDLGERLTDTWNLPTNEG